MNIIEFLQVFPDDDAARDFFTERRWPDGVRCPYCDGSEVTPYKHKTMPHRCKTCRKSFSVRTGTAMQSSRIGYQKWALAMFLVATRKKGVSSISLAADLGVTQRSAWYLLHRIRQAWTDGADGELLSGTVEADETYVGGIDYSRHKDKKGKPKTTVFGAKSRETGQVVTEVESAKYRDLHT